MHALLTPYYSTVLQFSDPTSAVESLWCARGTMRRTWILSLVMSSSTNKSSNSAIPWSKLAHAWKSRFAGSSGASPAALSAALTRTLPLLAEEADPSVAVPFVCRYRSDVIAPLQTFQIHQLAEHLQTHTALAALRHKLLDKIPREVLDDDQGAPSSGEEESSRSLRWRIETSLSKTELEDLYAPYKPPSKGSLEDRILKEHPALVAAIDGLWNQDGSSAGATTAQKYKPVEHAITLLANRIASDPDVMDACQAYTDRFGRIQVSQASQPKKEGGGIDNHGGTKKQQQQQHDTFQTYYGFEQNVNRLRDHQVLAIRRGVDKKLLKMKFDMDNDRAQGAIRYALQQTHRWRRHGDPTNQNNNASLWNDAIHDAWARLLRQRCTGRSWKAACATADERAVAVFGDNLRKALLAPPVAVPVLALDPGFAAGIKAALVDRQGQLLRHSSDKKNGGGGGGGLTTVHFMNGKHREGKEKLIELLETMQKHQQEIKDKETVVVALGNGHGSQEARKLIQEASQESVIPIEIQLVNEAGASVWSVTEQAARDYPNESAASIAALSIARRYQNPLQELVKIPPRSLGLGMYQHDFPAALLDRKLHVTSVDCVAEVGVDANAGSLEILEKVPSVTSALAKRIVAARPLQSRQDLLQISGLGPKTFENCAAFLRVQGQNELDQTLVHPESYLLAEYLLKKQKWKLNYPDSVGNLPTTAQQRKEEWNKVIVKAAKRFEVTEDRVLSVLDQLVRSITSPDPRLVDENGATSFTSSNTNGKIGSVKGCAPLEPRLHSMDELRKVCPVRSIVGVVRNVVDFGAFVDIGAEGDGLIHRSKLGPVALESLLVGQEVGVDVLGVAPGSNRVSLSLTGLNLPAIIFEINNEPRKLPAKGSRKRASAKSDPPAKKQRTKQTK